MAALGAVHKVCGGAWDGFDFGWHGACFAVPKKTVATSRNGNVMSQVDAKRHYIAGTQL
jgi:hypothetical protein